jgi:hypothetical protein
VGKLGEKYVEDEDGATISRGIVMKEVCRWCSMSLNGFQSGVVEIERGGVTRGGD